MMADKAVEIASATGLTIEVMGKAKLEELGCGGMLGVNQGSGSGGLVAASDGLTIRYDGTTWTYDFEPFRGPATKEECKDGGWENLRGADGAPFKNQGECVAYANSQS